MNEDNNLNVNNNMNIDNNTSPSPYRAMGNMNTVISNPSVNINSTMDVNIASAGTPVQNTSSEVVDNNNTPAVETNAYIPKEESVKKTQVVNDKLKKRTISLNLGKEFKIALLIIVILLIFIFLLPLLPNFF